MPEEKPPVAPTPPFFFQAEDGIRDVAVTGVQTCALPIFPLALAKKAVIAKQAGIERTSRCLGSICSPMRGLYKASRCPKGCELEHRKIAKMGCPRSHAMFTGLDGHPS